MSDETSTLLGSGESLDKGQAVDLLLNVEAPEEASEDNQEPVAEEVDTELETDEAESFEEEYEEDDAEELSDSEDEADDEEYDVDPEEVEEELYTVKIDGTEKQVTSEELVKSYQLEQAAQSRMQEAAATRKQAELEAQALLQQRQQYAQALAQVQAQLTAVQEPTKEQWDKLYQDDPLEWTRQRDAYRERRESVAKVQAEQDRMAQEHHQHALQTHQQKLAQEQQRMLDRIPEWKDEEVAMREKQAVINYAQRIGYTEQELSNASDSRAIEALRKAYLYDELMAKGPEAQKKVRKAPKAVKSGTPTTKRQRASSRNKQALAKLNKSGSKEDAVNFLLGKY